MGGMLELLTGEEVLEIHLATLDVLENVGVAFKFGEALKILDEAGASIDQDRQVAKIPEHLVHEAVKRVPSRFVFLARNPKYNLRIGGRRTYFTNGFGATYVFEPKTGRRRMATLKDLENFTRIADCLEHVHYPITHCVPQDVPKEVVGQYMALTMIKNTSKHYYCPTLSLEGAKDAISMASALMGGEEELRKRPTIINSTVCPTSPLQYSADAAARTIEFSGYRIPFGIWPAPLAGATGPATLAGTLVVQNAEVLAGVVLSQLVGAGTPVLYGTGSSVMDMTYGTTAYAAPELSLFNIATAQLARFYGLPTYGTGGVIDSKLPDEQAAYEGMMSNLLAALAGINIVHDGVYGILESGMTACYEQIVICHEMVGMVMRVLRGMRVTDEALALDVIEAVGHGGTFLSQKHTLQHFRSEHWIPQITDRSPRSEWERAGSKDIVQRAGEKIEEILRSHEPEPLDRGVEAALEEIVRTREKSLAR